MPRVHPSEALREIEIVPHFLDRHPASVLYSSGSTRVLCTATLGSGVPPFLEGQDKGWCTAEYSLLPGSTSPRHGRERNKLSGRTQEIQRLIGRSLRGIVDLGAMPGRTLQIDCDVLQADGGTRTASINGAYAACVLAVKNAIAEGKIATSPLRQAVGAVSVGIVDDELLVDLNYEEDSRAQVDLNLVQTRAGEFLEIQGTAEGKPFSSNDLTRLVELGTAGIQEIFAKYDDTLGT
jgi:ribonuclease PH